MTHPSPTLAVEIGAALDWWRAAGVDYEFADDATAWLVDADDVETSEGAPPRAEGLNPSPGHPVDAPENSASGPIDLLGDSPPATLEAFREFWMTAPGLDPIGPRGRVAPRGAAGAKLMVLVIDPEAGDSDSLLSGPQGKLLSNMLAAMGLSEDEVYYASALPRHTPMADTQAAAQAGLAAILALHIKLAAPDRIIAFGSNISPLLKNGVTNGETSLREINQKASSREFMISEGLDSLMAMPRLKTRFWRRWMEWSA